MKILQINTISSTGSTGRITEEIGQLLVKNGHQSYIAFGIGNGKSKSLNVKIGHKLDRTFHLINTRFFDLHGFGSKSTTKIFIKKIKEINPDLIHLHNLHGYYLNIEILFNFLEDFNKPIVWTLHDCWSFTGHCSYFDAVNCFKWQTECCKCPNKKGYPASIFLDNSKNNFIRKRDLFTKIQNITLVTPSRWLADHISFSFLQRFNKLVINNGVDINLFKPKEYRTKKKLQILGVANIWDERKGLKDFITISTLLNEDISIKLVGLKINQMKTLPKNIVGLTKTRDMQDLSEIYSEADLFLNPTYVDNFPTTNLESLSCGTPVITYDAGGSPEAVCEKTGMVVEKGNINQLLSSINTVINNGKIYYSENCRKRAERLYNKDDRYKEYLDLYTSLVKKTAI